MKIDYPILPDHTKSDEERKEGTIAHFFGHTNRYGFFPVGANNTWHGGIHLEDVSQSVRCIADGRVIAYRLSEDYIVVGENKYSNSFVLIQHNIETPKLVKLRFYSLYMHLRPKSELEEDGGKHIADLFATLQVKTKANAKVKGLKVRAYNEEDRVKSHESDFVPLGQHLTKSNTIAPANHWTKSSSKYVLCNWKGTTVCAHINCLTVSGDGYIVSYDREFNNINGGGGLGVRVCKSIDGQYDSKLPVNKEVEIEKTSDDDWYKLKGENKFIKKEDCESGINKIVSSDITLDKVENVDIPIKAGDFIGAASQLLNEKEQNYSAVHLEVFTDDENLNNFINNEKDDDKSVHLVKKDQLIQIAKPCNFLKKDMKVKLIEKSEGAEYVKVGYDNTPAYIDYYDDEKTIAYNSDGGYYSILDMDLVQRAFENKLPLEVSKLYYKGRYKKDGESFNPITKAEELELAQIQGYIKYRKVEHKVNKSYWVPAVEISGNEGSWITLRNHITSYFENQPNNLEEVKASKETLIRKKESISDSDGIEWWKIKTKDQEGWVKKEELIEKSAYKWSDYGWQLTDAGEDYFYIFGDYVSWEKEHAFIKKILDIVDNEVESEYMCVPGKDEKISNAEMQRALKTKSKLEVISKLICKHPSEWDMHQNFSDFEREYKKLQEKGLSQATSKKAELTEYRDKRIEEIRKKVENLSFWHLISNGELGEPIVPELNSVLDYGIDALAPFWENATENYVEKKVPSREFPSSSKEIYHFHPIAFVEQMKLIYTPDQAPWMDYAFEELKNYGGVRQTESPLKERIYEYFDSSSYTAGTNRTNWCAAFVNWCFEQLKDYQGTNPRANVAAFDWLPPAQARRLRTDVDGWVNCEVIHNVEEAFVGAVIVFSHSHVAFVAGQSEDGNSLIYIGGNQSDGGPNDGPGRRTICTNPKLKSRINESFWLVKPKGYKKPSNSELPVLSPDGRELGYADTHG